MHEISIKITINEKDYEKNIQANTLLIDFLREELNLTGSHIGCDTSQCGACMVLHNKSAIKSCSVLVAQLNNQEITTEELRLIRVVGKLILDKIVKSQWSNYW